MATTKITAAVLDLNAGRADYNLTATNTVTYVSSTGSNQYVFNGAYGTYGVVNGTYVLSSVSSSHPIAIINNGKTSEISYTGAVNEGTGTGPDGNTYTFYSGDVTITVSGNFDTVSYYCQNHGYMGGKDNLIYVSSVGESGLKMPSGTEVNRPTAVAGQIRNNTNETSAGSSSCMEYYKSSAWQKINNVTIPPVGTEHFNTVLYSGNSSTQAITGVGFQPDWVWIKERGPLAEQSNLYDSTRGVQKFLVSNSTAAEVTGSANRLNAFNADGFTVGSDNEINDSGSTYVAWCWKANGGTTSSNGNGDITSTVQANTDAGFSIITYTGNGSSAQTVGHGLNVAPDLLIIKERSGSNSWDDWTIGGNVIDNWLQNIRLNSDAARFVGYNGAPFANTAPTSTVFTVDYQGGAGINGSGDTFVVYAFASITGYSKFGSYTGTGASGNTVTVGFSPAWVMIKRMDSTGGWLMFDNKRNTSNPRNNRIEANTNQAEQTGSATKFVDFDATSFEPQISDSEINATGGTYLYLAFSS